MRTSARAWPSSDEFRMQAVASPSNLCCNLRAASIAIWEERAAIITLCVEKDMKKKTKFVYMVKGDESGKMRVGMEEMIVDISAHHSCRPWLQTITLSHGARILVSGESTAIIERAEDVGLFAITHFFTIISKYS